MSRVNVLMLRAPGTNCDVETTFAFQQVGADVTSVHINQLIRGEQRLSAFQILVIPGGFTYGDDISAGAILANELRLKLSADITPFIENGGLMLGICNGFQVLVKAGILPEPSTQSARRLTFASNDSGKFECRWVHLAVNPDSPCIFTRGIERMFLPVANGEGKLVAPPEMLPGLNTVLRYTDEAGNQPAGYPHNPSGSQDSIAGLCDSTGRIFALMPHPERHFLGTQHPQWTRLGVSKYGDGYRIFRNAVDWVKKL